MGERKEGVTMLAIKIVVDAPKCAAQGVKEHLAMYMEKFGDVRVVSVKYTGPKLMDGQTKMAGGP